MRICDDKSDIFKCPSGSGVPFGMHCLVLLGQAQRGKVRHSSARHGEARHGLARLGFFCLVPHAATVAGHDPMLEVGVEGFHGRTTPEMSPPELRPQTD